jgi:hypothetical protein
MRTIIFIPVMAAMLSLGACGRPGYGYGDRDRDGYRDRDRSDRRRDDDRRGARERHQLGESDRIYRDRDGRYYCQRRDGSRGAIVGALAGGFWATSSRPAIPRRSERFSAQAVARWRVVRSIEGRPAVSSAMLSSDQASPSSFLPASASGRTQPRKRTRRSSAPDGHAGQPQCPRPA